MRQAIDIAQDLITKAKKFNLFGRQMQMDQNSL